MGWAGSPGFCGGFLIYKTELPTRLFAGSIGVAGASLSSVLVPSSSGGPSIVSRLEFPLEDVERHNGAFILQTPGLFVLLVRHQLKVDMTKFITFFLNRELHYQFAKSSVFSWVTIARERWIPSV